MDVDRRYQVFVSSTYTDLVEERQEVIQALLELDLMPAGMELFPASDEDRWSLIKQVIDDSDYYLVIIGGRYGSVDEAGVSYTEREYDYAISEDKPVLGFVHAKPDEIPAGKTEATEAAREKLEAFRAKVQQRMCKSWTTPDELGGVVSRSLVKLMKARPAEGWVRGRNAATPELVDELSSLRAEVASLQQQQQQAASVDVEELSRGADPFTVTYRIVVRDKDDKYGLSFLGTPARAILTTHDFTWDELFAMLAPLMMDESGEDGLRGRLSHELEAIARREEREVLKEGERISGAEIEEDSFQAVKVQLFALGLIQKSVKKRGVRDTRTYWSLSSSGEAHLMRLRAIRRPKDDRQE